MTALLSEAFGLKRTIPEKAFFFVSFLKFHVYTLLSHSLCTILFTIVAAASTFNKARFLSFAFALVWCVSALGYHC